MLKLYQCQRLHDEAGVDFCRSMVFLRSRETSTCTGVTLLSLGIPNSTLHPQEH